MRGLTFDEAVQYTLDVLWMAYPKGVGTAMNEVIGGGTCPRAGFPFTGAMGVVYKRQEVVLWGKRFMLYLATG